MQVKILDAIRSVAAVAAGYAVIVIGTILTLEVWLGGVSYADADLRDHVAGASGTILAGLLGGYVAAWVARRKPMGHAFALVVVLVLEMAWILATGVGSNPAWFDAAGGLTLMVTAVLGAWVRARRTAPRARPVAA